MTSLVDHAAAHPGRAARTLVLGLGNDILADDAVGLLVARAVRESIGPEIDIVEAPVHGAALLDYLTGYDRAVIIDAIATRRDPPGTVSVIDPSTLSPAYAPSPHYAGMPEVMALAEALELDFPQEIAIVAVEVLDPLTIGGAMTPAVEAAVPEAAETVVGLLG